jgi:1-acyl-sn-glycerol-3-phosphate acyltransferase
MRGIDNLRKVKKPLVVVSNHMSTLETQVFPGIFYPFFPVTFIVKESLVKHFVFGPIMKSTNPITVGRVNPKQDFMTVMNEGEKILAQGTSIIVFPESTRRFKFIPANFNSMGIKLARKAGVKVLPVAIKTDFWGEGKYLHDLGPLDRSQPIHMAFGAPMNIEGNGKEQHQQCIDFIQSHMDSWLK